MDSNAKLDMSLDEIIRLDGIRGVRRGYKNRNSPRFGGRSESGGRFRSFNNNRNIPKRPYNFHNHRPRPYNNINQMNRDGHQQSRNRSYEPATLHVTNLGMSVTSDDLNELFSTFGILKRALVHYDQHGTSLGTGDVEFERRDEAIAARDKLNNVPLDGYPLRITLINISNDDAFTSYLKSTISNNNRPRMNGSSNSFRNRVGRNNYNNSNNNNSYDNGGGGGRRNRGNYNRNKDLTADDLDRDLDQWRIKSQEGGNVADGDAEEGMIEDDIE